MRRAGQAFQQFRREPGEPGAAGQGKEAGGAEAQDGDDACGPLSAQLRQDRGERRAGFVERGGRRPVVVDPRVAREIRRGDGSGEQRMIAPGDDAGGHVEEALAAQKCRQGFVGVDASAMQVAASVGEATQPLGAGRAADPEFDGGEAFPEAGGRVGEHGLGPRRGCGDAEHAGAPGAGGIDGLLGGLDLGEDAPGALHRRGPERGRTHPVRQALEQQAAEALLEPGDVAGERGLGDVRALRGRTDRARLGDGKEPEQVRSSLEHGDVPRGWGGRPHVPSGYMWGCAGGF